nr:NADH dehydrogenase [ubiquinone] 1 beta subcomplex subunit 2, mitochondrial-like isoform X2 [Lepeophtheirus salmonis]
MQDNGTLIIYPQNFLPNINRSQKMNIAFLYRKGFPPLRESDRKIMIAFNGFLWWWVFFNLFTDPWTALGHSPSIKPEKFTNEELGIPPDVE